MGGSSGQKLVPNLPKIVAGWIDCVSEFRRNSKQVDGKNFFYIEYLHCRGKHQLDQLKSPSTVGLSSAESSDSKKS